MCAITARSLVSRFSRRTLPRAIPDMASEFVRIFKALGFTYVTLDLEGFGCRLGAECAVTAFYHQVPPKLKLGLKPA